MSKKPDTPATPKRPPRQSVGLYDAFALPHFISDADRKNFYFHYRKESKTHMLKSAYHEPVIDPITNKQVRLATKDSEEDLLLFRLPMEYREEDLQIKRERVKSTAKDIDNKAKKGIVNLGAEHYNPDD